jgi:hypothetical protein
VQDRDDKGHEEYLKRFKEYQESLLSERKGQLETPGFRREPGHSFGTAPRSVKPRAVLPSKAAEQFARQQKRAAVSAHAGKRKAWA